MATALDRPDRGPDEPPTPLVIQGVFDRLRNEHGTASWPDQPIDPPDQVVGKGSRECP
jgi:hypothetical protein